MTKKIATIAGIVIVLMILVLIAVPFLIDANQFRPELQTQLSNTLGRAVKVGNLELSLVRGRVAADDISIADDPAFSPSPFVAARALNVGIEWKPLILSKEVRITTIELEEPQITLRRSSSGVWNFSSLGGKPGKTSGEAAKGSSSENVSVGLMNISRGRLTVVREGSKPSVYEKVDITARDLSRDSAFPFGVAAVLPGGGTLKLEGQAGPISRTDASLTPFSAQLSIRQLNLVSSGFIDPESGLAGILDFDCGMSSDGKVLESKGRATADKFQMVKSGSAAPKPINLQYALLYDLNSQSGSLKDTTVEFGKAAPRMEGTFTLNGSSTFLRMKLRGENMPAEDLQSVLPAVGAALPSGASLKGGDLNVSLGLEGPLQNLVTTGSVGLFKTRLAGFDLGSRLAAVSSLAGIKSNSVTDIEKFASQLRMTPEGIEATGLSLLVPAIGELSGNGRIGSDQSLDFKMLARLTTNNGVLGALTRITRVNAGSGLSVPFFIRGTTSKPSFVPDTKGAAASLLGSSPQPDSKPANGLQNLLKGLIK